MKDLIANSDLDHLDCQMVEDVVVTFVVYLHGVTVIVRRTRHRPTASRARCPNVTVAPSVVATRRVSTRHGRRDTSRRYGWSVGRR